MLKLIHCADIHLGSKMEAKLPKDKADQRRSEVRKTFHRLVEYAKAENVRAILLSGDVFDSDRPLKRDKEIFYDVIKGNPEIDFLYLRGNHDGKESYTEDGLENLKTFTEEWTEYRYGDVCVCGIEMSKSNALSLYSTLKLEKGRKNIVALHGQVSASAGMDKIHLPSLADKNVDYLALGHVHSYTENRLDDRGRYAYSGCLEGRGFDELGEKGFVLLEIDNEVKSTFVPFAQRTIHECNIDLSSAENVYGAYVKVKSEGIKNPSDLYRMQLVGEITFDNDGLADELENLLSTDCYFVSVKDKTLRKINPEDYAGDLTLRGEFVRSVLARADWSDERKSNVIALGLKALSGQEVD
jgi:DNA repair exonuclease SbcCD nuclease subunit